MQWGDLELEAKRVAALIGRSIHSLGHARRANAPRYLNMPPHVLRGRHVRYRFMDVVRWAEERGVSLHWDAMPLHLRLYHASAAYLDRAMRARQALGGGVPSRRRPKRSQKVATRA